MPKVSALPNGSAIAGTEKHPGVQGGASVAFTYDQVADFILGLSSLAELIRDTIGTAATAGTGVTVTVNDGADTITFALDTAVVDERARDALGTALVAGSGVTITPNDGADTITIATTITQYTDEMARDAIGAALTDAGLVVVTPNDGADTIDINVPAASASDLNTGTDTTKAVTSDALAGSNLGIRYISVGLNGTTALTTSDLAYIRIPAAYNGMNLVSVAASVGTGAAGSSSSGTPTFTVKNVTDGNQMLSTNLTVDANEYTSATAATPAVINGSFDDVVTDDLIEVACTVAGTGVTYATITLGFQLP